MRTTKQKRLFDLGIMAAIVVIWILLDQVTKAAVNSFDPNEQIAGPFLGIFDITLVRNGGAAWGVLDGNSLLLGAFSLVVCAFAILYMAFAKPVPSIGVTIGIAMVVAGGIGNAIDRFSNGYVIDFIRPVFIDFPVFNIADIGVTIGVCIFVISLIIEARKSQEETDE